MSSIGSKGDQDQVAGKAIQAQQHVQLQKSDDDVEDEAPRQVDWTESEERKAKRKSATQPHPPILTPRPCVSKLTITNVPLGRLDLIVMPILTLGFFCLRKSTSVRACP